MKSILVFLLYLINGIHILPAGFPNLTAEYNERQRAVLLKWQNTDNTVTMFVLQRSDDNNNWKDIYGLRAEKFSKKKLEKFSDRYPDATKNYYRLKIMRGTDDISFSDPIMVIIGKPLNSWIMYPVPVRDVLNLQYNGSDAIQGVISVFIQNMSGYILIRKRFSSLSRVIQVPVDNLGRGTYDVRIMINEEVVWNQRFIK